MSNSADIWKAVTQSRRRSHTRLTRRPLKTQSTVSLQLHDLDRLFKKWLVWGFFLIIISINVHDLGSMLILADMERK